MWSYAAGKWKDKVHTAIVTTDKEEIKEKIIKRDKEIFTLSKRIISQEWVTVTDSHTFNNIAGKYVMKK